MNSVIRLLAVPSFLALMACAGEAKSVLPPQPPMWIVTDADSEITLYPTLHVLPEDIIWKSEELTRRLEGADEVWFEIMPGSESDPALQQSMMKLGLAPGFSLSSKLTEDEIQKLRGVIESLGMPFELVDSMKPWLASTLVGVGELINKGFKPDAGVERQLHLLVVDKKIRALETPQEQMEMLSSLPESLQLEILRETLSDLGETAEVLKELAQDWAAGDVDELRNELLVDMKRNTPMAYDAVFTTRNKNWADQIEIEMKGSGTDFIAVGAGHLVGDDGVPAILRNRGYRVKRLR